MTGLYRVAAIVIAASLGSGWARADLTAARAEMKLEKRAAKALDNAEKMLRSANKSYKSGDWDKTLAALEEVRESVDLAYTALKETGKDPRRKPKHFKRAEIKTRNVLRNLEDFRLRMSIEDRERIEPIRQRIQDVHDDLLEGIMGTGDWRRKK